MEEANLHEAEVGGHGLHRLAESHLEGLVAGHLDLSGTLGVDRRARRLGWRGGSRGRLVLVGLEERHGYCIVAWLERKDLREGGRVAWCCFGLPEMLLVVGCW